MPNVDIYSFLAIWFENLRKNIFKVQVVNEPKDDTVAKEISKILPYLQELRTKEFSVNISNQKDTNFGPLEAKLDKLIATIQGIEQPDNVVLEGLLRDLIRLSGDIKEVKVLNNPEIKMPSKMSVNGEVSVSNFPKGIEHKPMDLSPIVKGLQVVVDSIRELKLEFANLPVGGSNVIATSTGSHKDRSPMDLGLAPAFKNVPASQTDYTIVAARDGNKIRVISAVMQAGATATNLVFNTKPSGAGTAISMTYQNAANGGEVLNPSLLGWFETNIGEGLTVTTGAGSTTGVQVNYVLV